MQSKAYQRLVCPFCQTQVKRVENLKYWPGTKSLEQGVLWCECPEPYPIIAGIAVFQREATQVVGWLRAGETYRAVAQLTELHLVVRRVYLWSLRFLSVLGSNSYKTILSLMELSAAWTGQKFLAGLFRYLQERSLRSSYALNLATLPLWQQVNTASSKSSNQPLTLVDLGAGGGDLTAELASKLPAANLYLVEKKFWLVYLAVMTGQLPRTVIPVVSDLENRLPFVDGFCQGVMINDCLMYVDHQRAFLAEVARIMAKQNPAVVTCMHVHSAESKNVAQGNGVKPADLTSWLPKTWRGRCFDDKNLFQHLKAGEEVAVKPVALSHPQEVAGKSFSLVAMNNNWPNVNQLAPLKLSTQLSSAKAWLSFEDPEWL